MECEAGQKSLSSKQSFKIITDTLKFSLEFILNFISKIQWGTWGLKLHMKKPNRRVAQNLSKILDIYISSVNSYRLFG